ncbi:unnamed protein product [Moneuplotes crassus]|uniref:Uncharacterized protein n=1 Tax=Euplotes crassus TaxID=5936 RepID=A0AAD1XVK3_EUPCR|nr:unnamed protein product [Moneuplotes crassus]
MELKTVIFSKEHGSTFKWTGYKERNRNVKNPFFSNPYIYCPEKKSTCQKKSRNTKAGAFRTTSQINDLMRGFVSSKKEITTTYQDESKKAWKPHHHHEFSDQKPIMICPDSKVKTNYHFPGKNYEIPATQTKSLTRIPGHGALAQTITPANRPRNTFSSLGFKNMGKKMTAKGSTDRIFRRHNKVPIFDFTNQKMIPKDQMAQTQRDVYKEARPMAIYRPRVFSPMTKYRIGELKRVR